MLRHPHIGSPHLTELLLKEMREIKLLLGRRHLIDFLLRLRVDLCVIDKSL